MRNTTTKSLVRTSFLLAAALALTPAIGATVTWDTSSTAGFQSGNGTWGTDSFWSSNGTTLSPWVSGDAAVFLGETTAVTNTITVGSAQNISGLSFGSATTFGDWTFAGSGMSLSANSTFTVNAGSTASIGNTISGAFGLTKAGTGGLTLTGANTYSGATTVSAGTLTLASGASLATSGFNTAAGATLALNASTAITTLNGAGNIQIGAGATLTLNNSTAQSIGSGVASSLASTGAFSGAGTFVKSGTGLLYVQGDFSSTTTNVTLSGGSFQFVGSSGADTNAFGTGTITVTANSTLNTYTDGTRTKSSRLLNAIVVTGGTLALGTGSGGSGSLILAGGLTATNAANVTVGGGRVILESDLAMNGTGAFTLTGGTLQLGNNTATGSINGGLSFNATAGALDFKRSDNVTYSGAFSGTGTLSQTGSGNLTLTGANTYTGTTTVSAGTLTLASGATMGAGALSVASGASLVLNASATTATLTGSGAITIGTGITFTLNTTAGNPQFLGTFSGAGSLVKSGAGEVFLTGDNSGFTGAITINGGMISVQNSISILGSGDITVTANATVGTYTGQIYTTPGRLNNKLTVTAGTLTLGRNGRTILGNDVIASGTGSIVVGGGGTTVIEKDISNTGTGALSVASGTTLQLGNGGTTGTFNGGLSFNQSAGNLAFNRSDNINYTGVLSGTGSLTQAGTGNLTLTGANTYTGVTTVSAGTLTLASGATMSAAALSVASGASLVLNASATISTFTGSGAVTVNTGSTLNLGTSANVNSVTIAGGTLAGTGTIGGVTATSGTVAVGIVGSGAITKTGAGVLELQGNGGATGNFTGNMTLTAGTIKFTGTGSLGSISSSVANYSGVIANQGILEFAGTATQSLNGVISGAGSLAVTGGGQVLLQGNNTYAGGTTVSSGTATAYSTTAFGAGAVTVSGTGVVDLGGQATTNNFSVNGGTLRGGSLSASQVSGTSGTISANLTGSGSFSKTGTGSLILSGTNSHSGGTTVSAGTLLVNGTTGAVTVASGGTLGGNGYVGNTSVSSGGTIAAGASVGLLNVANLTLAGGSFMDWQLYDAGAMAGVGYDLIVASFLDLSGLNPVNRVTLNLMTLANPADSVSGTPLAFDRALSQSFTLINYATLNLGANSNVANLFTIDLNGFRDQSGVALNAADFSVFNNAANNSLELRYVSAVPEPSTYGLALGFLSLAVVAIRRQRRKPSAQA